MQSASFHERDKLENKLVKKPVLEFLDFISQSFFVGHMTKERFFHTILSQQQVTF